MSEAPQRSRGSSRGNRGGSSSRGDSSSTRGGRGHSSAGGQQQSQERPKKENILDLKKYEDKRITVKFTGGREVVGTLKGHDQLLNLVLDDVEEIFRDDEGNTTKRQLGLLVARGTLLTSISPLDGSREIENPFAQADEDEDE